MKKDDLIVIYTDGGSRGNPGPSGIGVVVEYDKGKIKEYAEAIGEKTNNEAEYQALVFALKKAKSLVGKKRAKLLNVHCFADSELMVRQLNHQYKIQNANIQPLFLEVWNLTLDFKQVIFEHIAREKNKRADQLANQAMDKVGTRLFK
ncbi:MAG TPA: ribonuclease HI family protein [Candidatus Moranbacteria bacterium]|nr:ribonuclease HI family protein [Candidatus Moranbacteria bacterium]